MSTEALKMDALLGLGRNSIVKMTENTARWNIDPYRLEIDVRFPPELWELKKGDKAFDWKRTTEVSKEIRDIIGGLEIDYNEAIKACSEGSINKTVDEPEEVHVESFEEPGTEVKSVCTLDDATLIKQIDAVMRSTKGDKTLWGIRA